MGTPTILLLQLQRYRENGGFPSDLGASDRNAFFRLNDAFMETYPQFQSIYYGLEDGVFAGHGFSSKIANYREPGHSGYEIVMEDDGDAASGRAKDESMEKHYGACVNSTVGGEIPCLMNTGGKYTQCTAMAPSSSTGPLFEDGEEEAPPLFDCLLEKCTDEASQRDCDALTNNETEHSECLANIKWCSSYIIKEAFDNETLGFINRGTHCIDRTGVPSQMLEEVVQRDTMELGNCYYKDGSTLVHRDRVGDFAYCGGNGKVCNDTFVGAYISRDYDPRWRGWYIATKELQKPNWSPPYPFFRDLEMGITFSVPIYSMQDDKNVFAGVLAIDATLEDLKSFLQTNYKVSVDCLVQISCARVQQLHLNSLKSFNTPPHHAMQSLTLNNFDGIIILCLPI